MSALLPPKQPSGHRRVKSLVREFDDIVKVPSPAPGGPTSPISPISPTGLLPSPSSSTGAHSPTHTRRAASVSYSPANQASFASPPVPYKSSAFPSTLRGSPDQPPPPTNSFGTPASHGVSSHKRRASYSPSAASGSSPSHYAPMIPSPSPSPISNGHHVLANVAEEDEVTTDQPQVDREEDDVFLPLSPNSAAPFQVNFANPTPTTPNFPSANQHNRSHSRIHERNLSAFFPRPGQAPGSGYGDTFADPHGSNQGVGGVKDIPKGQAATGSAWSAHEDAGAAEDARSKAGRRGHHHRHSLSHNFFSFMDPTEQQLHQHPDFASPPLPGVGFRSTSPGFGTPPTPMVGSSGAAGSSFLPAPSHALRSKYAHLPYPVRLLVFSALYLPLRTQVALAISVGQIILGASLWVTGQAGESLSVTGLGYLVVFDGMGGLSNIFVEGGAGIENLWSLMGSTRAEKGLRMPFGPSRYITLSHFSQAIYLLFSAVYVCKESVEHVLLLHGGTEDEGAHGTGHGGMGHGEGGLGSVSSGVDVTISLPLVLLGLSAFLSFISAAGLRNHQTLTQAMGPTSFSRPLSKASAPSLIDLVGNPFTLTVLIFSLGLSTAAYVLPSAQLAPLDKVVALLQSLAMFYVAYPAAVATGQVLLQTSPSSNVGQMKALLSGIRDIENHPLVVEVTSPHIWQLTPHPSASASQSSTLGGRSSGGNDGEAATLVATLVVSIKNDASDDDILQVTKFARERCTPALRWGNQGGGSKSHVAPGELTVSVVRAHRRQPVQFIDHHSMHGAGQHEGHSHSHSHSSHSGHPGHSHSH
ncbi:hypothetical protein T439DRAFT_325505 [Meredithblackwellia eburnea MCA 4105]